MAGAPEINGIALRAHRSCQLPSSATEHGLRMVQILLSRPTHADRLLVALSSPSPCQMFAPHTRVSGTSTWVQQYP